METKRFNLLNPNSAWLWLLVLATTAHSQNPEFYCGSFKNGSDPNRQYEYYDRFGNGYMEEDLYLSNLNIQQNSCSVTEDFKLVFESGNGGFSSDEIGTICEVFNYLSGIIDAPSGERATVRFKKDPTLDSDVVATGTAYFNTHCRFGYSIVDIQLNLGGLSSALQHATINVNTEITNFYFGPAGDIGSSQLDYYTAILHEALHTLGFASRISTTGDPLTNFYSSWDLNLISPAGDYLILAEQGSGEPLCCAGYKFNSDDFPGMPDIIWNQDCGLTNIRFDVAQLPPVNGEYTIQNPDKFNQVLSHLDRACGPEHYVMNAGIPQGSDGVQRILTDSEISILCKLGYNVQGCDLGCIALAEKDGNFFVDLNETINIDFSELLSNDFPVDATLSYKPNCGDHNGLLIPLPVNNVFQITGLTLGDYTFCYTITSCDGRICDETTVGVVVTNPAIATACQDLDLCQINKFWDFELFGSKGEMAKNLALSTNPSTGANAFKLNDDPAFSNTPDFIVSPTNGNDAGCGNAFVESGNGTKRIRLYTSLQGDVSKSEGIMFPLCETIFPGMKGQVTLRAMISNTCISEGYTPQIKVEFMENSPIQNVNIYTNPGINSISYLEPIVSSELTNPIYETHTLLFQNDSDVCWNFMCLSGELNGTFSGWLETYWYVDDVKVELSSDLLETLEVNTSVGQSTPCLGEVVTFSIEVCNNTACLPNTFSNPEFSINATLPPGLSHVPNADFPSLSHLVAADEITYGECITLELTAQVGGGAALIGQQLPLGLSFDPVPPSCFYGANVVAGSVTPQLCPGPFDCSCEGEKQINIDASPSSPFYNDQLGGTLYSDLEAFFNYDNNDDHEIGSKEHNNCIAILGNLIIDEDLSILECENIKMQPCSEITIGTSAFHSIVDLTKNTLYSCHTMWHGITVTPHATLNFTGNEIRDAQFANTAIGGVAQAGVPPTKLIAEDNAFLDNHVGVFFPENASKTVAHIPFTGNSFKGTADLLPPCDADLPNYSSTLRGYAGVVTLGSSLTVGTPAASGYDNTFGGIRNGIIGEKCILIVNRANIQDLIGGTDVYPPSFAGAIGNGVVAINGKAAVVNSKFAHVPRGVFGHANKSLTVSNNRMTSMIRGVETLAVGRSVISNNPIIEFADRGILCREVISGGGTLGVVAHRIEHNTDMYITPSPNGPQYFSAAIEIDNALSTDIGAASISNNRFSNKGFFGHGIRINGSGGWDIADNILDFQAPAVPSAYFNVGIHLTNTNANYIYHNTVNDLAQQLNESTALSLADGTGNRYCCNITRGSRFGSRFLGACNKTEWRVTDMYNHEFALECGPGTAISPQLNYGDNFNETSGTAFHGGDDGQVFNSRFQVFSMLQPNWPEAIALPNIILNTQFFDVDGPDAYCVAPCTTPQYAPAPPDRFIDESDLTTVYGGFATGPYGTALQWENERRLYERMSDYGGMIGANATTDAFYTTASNVRIGAYYQAEHAAKGIYNYPTNIYNGLQTSTAQLESNRLAVEAILMGLEQAQNHADSALIYLNANTQLQAGQAIAEALLNYQILAQAYSNAASSNAYIPTNALPADNLLEQNRKAVQQLYLQTLGMGIAQLNPQQLAQAEAIAVQCPLLGGSAVYAARALYRLNNDRAFVDDELCMLSHVREEVPGKQSVFEGLSLAPNPANETVTINGLFVSQEQPVEVRLLDMNGKVFIHQVIETGDAKISIQGLLEGVYVCQIKVKDQAPVALKLIVVRKN